MYIPVNPSFTIYMWGVRGSTLHGHVYMVYVKQICAIDVHRVSHNVAYCSEKIAPVHLKSKPLEKRPKTIHQLNMYFFLLLNPL